MESDKRSYRCNRCGKRVCRDPVFATNCDEAGCLGMFRSAMTEPWKGVVEEAREFIEGRCGVVVPRDADVLAFVIRRAIAHGEEQLQRRTKWLPDAWSDMPPLTDEHLHGIKVRWATGPERYQADADALIGEVLRLRAEAVRAEERMRERAADACRDQSRSYRRGRQYSSAMAAETCRAKIRALPTGEEE